jgi:hypothetical protein
MLKSPVWEHVLVTYNNFKYFQNTVHIYSIKHHIYKRKKSPQKVPQLKTKNLNAAVLKDMICYEKVLFLLCFIYLTCPYEKTYNTLSTFLHSISNKPSQWCSYLWGLRKSLSKVLFESTCSCTSLDLSKIAIFKRYTFSDYFVPKISACTINFGIKIWSANKARVGSSSLVWRFHKLNSLNKNFKLIYQSSSKWNTARGVAKAMCLGGSTLTFCRQSGRGRSVAWVWFGRGLR